MSAKSLEVTINDKSQIYAQAGARRAELQAAASKAIMGGKKTIHLSLRYDTQRLLNYTHEYVLFFQETSDFKAMQLSIKTGAILGGTGDLQTTKQVLRVFGNSASNNKVLFETGFVSGWHNFAFELDFDKNTVLPYYSANDYKLKAVASAPIANSLSGGGVYHFGVLKKPTETTDYLYNGYQEKGINEGIMFGGMFIENGELDCAGIVGVGK